MSAMPRADRLRNAGNVAAAVAVVAAPTWLWTHNGWALTVLTLAVVAAGACWAVASLTRAETTIRRILDEETGGRP